DLNLEHLSGDDFLYRTEFRDYLGDWHLESRPRIFSGGDRSNGFLVSDPELLLYHHLCYPVCQNVGNQIQPFRPGEVCERTYPAGYWLCCFGLRIERYPFRSAYRLGEHDLVDSGVLLPHHGRALPVAGGTVLYE